MNKVQIIGTGSYVPENVVTNKDLSKIIETNDEWIISRTGIKERRISMGEDTSDFATKAALKAMESAGVSAEQIDLIVIGTYTPDSFIPSTACIVQKNIGAVNATCYDLSAACSGFLYSLDVAVQYIRTGRFKTVLAIGAETQSKVINWEDRTTAVLFGDGAGAAILTAGEKDGIKAIYTKSDGSKGQFLTVHAMPVINPFVENKNASKDQFIRMEGREIFKFAVNVISETIERLLEKSGYCAQDIKLIIPHQANKRIIEFTARRIGIDENKFFVNLDKCGNTSAASIAIALDEAVRSDLIKNGDKVILVAFGGGLTYGGMLIEWNSN